MIGLSGIIFQNSSGLTEPENPCIKLENPDGDSGVGQASEFPSGSLSLTRKKIKFLIPLLALFIFLFGVRLFIPKTTAISEKEIPVDQSSGLLGKIVSRDFQAELRLLPDANFSLVIPKIDLSGRVIAGVDAANPDMYLPMLLRGIAHAKGSSMPGESGIVYLFAHAAQTPDKIKNYNAVFYNLGELDIGDGIFVYYQKHKYEYTVIDKMIVDADDITEIDRPVTGERLILQTCEFPLDTNKRLLVVAERY